MLSTDSKIYIVDDDELVRKTLKAILLCSGYCVHTYRSAKVLLQEVQGVHDGCLIIDLNMPDVDGLQLQLQLLQRNIHLPIIFISGAGDINSVVQGMSKGAFSFLQKPISNSALLNTVQTAITQYKQKCAKTEPIKAARHALSILTERELAIAYQVADGLSASSIAERLSISNRTVEAHKASVFSKLDINNIAQLTRLVVLANLADENT